MDEKIYCGAGRIVSGKFGDITKISLSKDNINSMVKYMKENGLDWINLELKEKKEKQEGKPTHYLQVDTWKPEAKPKPEVTHDPEVIVDLDPASDEDGLPF